MESASSNFFKKEYAYKLLDMMNDYHKKRSEDAMNAVKKMIKNPLTREQALEQVVRLFKQDMDLNVVELAIWNNTEITEHKRILEIKRIRAERERMENPHH